MDLEVKKESLRKHIIDKGIILGEYAPKKKSRIMYDSREALLGGNYLSLAAELIWDKIKKYDPTYLVGSGVAAQNIMLAVKVVAELNGNTLNVLLNRGERKTTNRQRLVEGPRPSLLDRAVYIDDIMNTGSTWAKTQAALKEEGIKIPIIAVCVLVDFWTYRGTRRLEILGVPVERLFYRHDFGDTRQDPKGIALTDSIAWRNLAHNQWIDYLKAPPYIFKDKVYYANDRHEVYCHDLETGDIIWEYRGPKPWQEKGTCSVLQIVNGVLYFTSYDGSLTAVYADTGQIKWKKHLDMFMHGTPWIDEQRQQIYLGTEGGIQNRRGDIVCLDLETARTKWVFPTQHVIPCSPSLVGNNVVCGSNDGYLYSINADTGKFVFSLKTGEVKGRVNYIDDIILACSEDGKLHGISQDGAILWTRSCGTTSRHQFLPVYRDAGLVILGNTDGMIVAYDKHGTQVWLRNLRDDVCWNITLKGNELMVLTGKAGHLYQLDPLNGNKLKYQKLSYITRAPCDFNSEYIAINSSARGLYIYRRKHD
jgi:outer membrane protein assembly factor BamB/orotate phosphoribosyltransferase